MREILLSRLIAGGGGGNNRLNISSIINIKYNDIDVYDDRVLAKGINTILDETLNVIIDKELFSQKRVLEIGPKYGYHSKWIDKNLNPSELVMLELSQKDSYIQEWIHEIKCPHQVVFESIIVAESLMKMEKFELIFFTGVLYHNVEHFKILNILRRCLTDTGIMIFQTSVDLEHEGAVINIKWNSPEQKGSYAHPTKEAVLKMLAMTGWDNINIFTRYRPNSNAILMTCKKSEILIHAYDNVAFGGSKI